jgi:hypothetical protein
VLAVERTKRSECLPASEFWVSSGSRHAPDVPVVSLFLGIVIRMYHHEHPPPHFHAAYQGFEAFVRIEDGEIVHGSPTHPSVGAGPSGRTQGKLAARRGFAADGDDPRSGCR